MTKHLSYMSPKEIVRISAKRQGRRGRIGPLLSLLSVLHPFYLSILFAMICLIMSFFNLAFISVFFTIIFFQIFFYNRTKSAATSIEIIREVPERALENSELKVIYRVKNLGKQSIGPIIFRDIFSGSIKNEYYMRIESGLGPDQWVRYSQKFKTDRGIGPQSFSNLLVVLQDPFGLFGFRVEFIGSQSVDVLPETKSLAEVGLTGIEEITRFGNLDVQVFGDSPCFSGARDYRSGDPMKWISWKLSAKKGEFVVKEYEKLSSPDISLILEMNAKYHLENIEKSSVDEVKRVGILLAKQLADQNASLQLFSQALSFFRDHSYYSIEALVRGIRHLSISPDDGSLIKKFTPFIKPGEYLVYISAFYLLPVEQLIRQFEVLLARQVKIIGVFIDVSSYVDASVLGLSKSQKKELDLTAEGRKGEIERWFQKHSQQVYFCLPDSGEDLKKKVMNGSKVL